MASQIVPKTALKDFGTRKTHPSWSCKLRKIVSKKIEFSSCYGYACFSSFYLEKYGTGNAPTSSCLILFFISAWKHFSRDILVGSEIVVDQALVESRCVLLELCFTTTGIPQRKNPCAPRHEADQTGSSRNDNKQGSIICRLLLDNGCFVDVYDANNVDHLTWWGTIRKKERIIWKCRRYRQGVKGRWIKQGGNSDQSAGELSPFQDWLREKAVTSLCLASWEKQVDREKMKTHKKISLFFFWNSIQVLDKGEDAAQITSNRHGLDPSFSHRVPVAIFLPNAIDVKIKGKKATKKCWWPYKIKSLVFKNVPGSMEPTRGRKIKF